MKIQQLLFNGKPRNLDNNHLPIISDALIGSKSIGDGKMIPSLIIDTANRPDVEKLILHHKDLPPGDAVTSWAQIRGHKNSIALIIEFNRPSELSFILLFDIAKQGILVDSILSAKSVYLQSGSCGDRMFNTVGVPRIILEVPDMGFSKDWSSMWRKTIIKAFRKKGLNKKDAINACNESIKRMREISKKRV